MGYSSSFLIRFILFSYYFIVVYSFSYYFIIVFLLFYYCVSAELVFILHHYLFFFNRYYWGAWKRQHMNESVFNEPIFTREIQSRAFFELLWSHIEQYTFQMVFMFCFFFHCSYFYIFFSPLHCNFRRTVPTTSLEYCGHTLSLKRIKWSWERD